MLRYNLKVQLLGHLRVERSSAHFRFSVGERAFATLGSKVRLPSPAALAFLCNIGLENDPTAAPLGYLAYGQRELPDVPVRFSVGRLKGKRCLAVLEEAQTFLGERALDDRNVFVRWVKEGRKYGLGAILFTQQPGSIANQIISQGDNFIVLHLLNENDLQTLQRHNAYYSDEILHFIRSEPIPGNCYFWSAPNQPFVLPVRVCNFETVCQTPWRDSPARTASPPAAKQLGDLIAKAVEEALGASPRLWLYRVSGFAGKKETGWVAFSRDYLLNIVAQRLSEDADFKRMANGAEWLKTDLPLGIENVLKRHEVRSGYAVLEGVTRPIHAISQADLKLEKGKTLRPMAVEVNDNL